MVMTDLRLAVRALRQSPTFTSIAVLSLALGIGASTSVYSLVFTLFFAPPIGVDEPERLARICRLRSGQPEGHEISYAEYRYYRAHATLFTELAADGNVKWLTDTETGNQLLTGVVSPSYFTVLGLRARAGRFFSADEDRAGAQSKVVVVSHAFWQRRFAGDARRIGGRLMLGMTPYTIVGVAPQTFAGSSAGWAPDIYVPTHALFSDADLARNTDEDLDLIGRLEPGRTLAEAQAEMSVLAGRLAESDPGTHRGARLVVSKLRGLDPEARSDEARLPALLVTAVACLLVIACVNLAGLLQTRHAARSKEIAIRLALGAGRRRVVRQLLTESLLLSALGGAGGLIVAWWGKALLEAAYAREMFDGTRHLYPLTLDARAFVLTLVTAAATSVVFGLVPALHASRPVLVPALKEDASTLRRSRLRAIFLIVQVAVSIALLIGAALVIQSARTVRRNPGFDARHVAYFNINPARAGYRGDKAMQYANDVRRRLESVSVVESVSFSWVPPPLWADTADLFLPGQQPVRSEDALKVPVNWVSARFFETLHMPVLHGRGFDERDVEQRRSLAVVNEALARRLWTDADAVGRTLLVNGRPFDVVGIVRYEGLRAGGDTARPYLFCSSAGRRQQGSVFVRVKGDELAVLPTLRREILAVDATVPISQATSLSRVIANQEAAVPVAMGVLSFAGGVALLLTILGLYGVVALWVGQRTREIAIRVALGAKSGTIVRLVLLEGVRLVLIGLPLGVGAAIVAGRLLSSYLYGVSATDAATFSAITASIFGVAVFACYVPATRALRVDPVQVLRHD